MRRTPWIAVLILTLGGCGPGANQRSGVIPQADTPPDPPALVVAQSSSLDSSLGSSLAPASSAVER